MDSCHQEIGKSNTWTTIRHRWINCAFAHKACSKRKYIATQVVVITNQGIAKTSKANAAAIGRGEVVDTLTNWMSTVITLFAFALVLASLLAIAWLMKSTHFLWVSMIAIMAVWMIHLITH